MNEKFEEISQDILEYMALKLPDADPIACSEVVAYIVRRVIDVMDYVAVERQKNTKSYMAILLERAGECLKNDQTREL